MKNSDVSTAKARIAKARAQLLMEYIDLLQGLDESDPDNWADIIKTVREAGVDKDELCSELSCAWSTIFRWENRQSVPGPFARAGIKSRLMELLRKMIPVQREIAAAAE